MNTKMKNTAILLVVCLFCASVSFAQSNQDNYKAPSGYQGFLEQGNGITFGKNSTSMFMLSTTHGCHINPNLYLGAGFSFSWNDEYVLFPLYTAFRYNVLQKKISPVMQIRLGSYLGEGGGQFGDLSVGLRFGTSRDFAFSVTLAGTYFEPFEESRYIEYFDADGSWLGYAYESEKINLSNISLRFCIEW